MNQEEHIMLIVKSSLKTIMFKKSILCNYSDAYIFVKGPLTIRRGANAAARHADERNKGVAFKNCDPLLIA